MAARFATLGLEELDVRTLPSATLPLATAPVMVAVIAPPSHPLHGEGEGKYVGNSLVVDAGTYDKLSGRVKLAGFESFHVSGWVQGVGMIAQGRATGELTLSNDNGTITLLLHGPIQSAFSSIPSEMVYSISSATGVYQGVTGYGLVSIGFLPAPTAFGLPPQGEFTLSIY